MYSPLYSFFCSSPMYSSEAFKTYDTYVEKSLIKWLATVCSNFCQNVHVGAVKIPE